MIARITAHIAALWMFSLSLPLAAQQPALTAGKPATQSGTIRTPQRNAEGKIVPMEQEPVTAAEKLVSNAQGLQQAIAIASPGQQVMIAPGRYVGSFYVPKTVSGTAERPIVITAAKGLGSVVIDGNGTEIVWKFAGSSHIVLRGLEITGGGYHGVFFESGAHDIAVVGNSIHDNHRTLPMDSHAEIKGASGGKGRPARILIQENEIFHSSHPPGGNFQGIDCNFCDDFRIVGNYIHDINRPTGQPYSYYDRGSCIQMKSGSLRSVIENNRIERCQFGILLGGEGAESPENIDGSVRNNLILDSVEIGIAIVNARGATIYHNTVLGPEHSLYFGVDRDSRSADSRNEVQAANNLLSAPTSGTIDNKVVLMGNVVIPGLTAAALFGVASAEGISPASRFDAGTVDLGGAVLFDYTGYPRPQGRAPVAGAMQRFLGNPRWPPPSMTGPQDPR